MKMTRFRLPVLAVLFTLLCLLSSAQAQTIPYRTSFEPPDFLVGAVNGQDGWAGTGEIQSLTAAFIRTGTQSLQVGESSVVSRSLTGPGSGKVYIDGYYRGPVVSATPDPTTLGEGSSLLLFHDTQGIMALNGNGTGGGTWVASGVTVPASALQRITLCQDYDAKSWTLFIDQQPIPGVFGFKNNTITHLSGIDIETSSAGKGYLDDFAATTAVPEFFDHSLFDFSMEWQHSEETGLNWDLVPTANEVDARDLLEFMELKSQ